MKANVEWRIALSLLLSGALLSGCATPSAGEPTIEGEIAPAGFAFEKFEIATGTAERQTILTGFFFEGPVADLAVVTIDENSTRRLRIFSFGNGAWERKLDAELRPEVLFVDVARIGGRDRLLSYGAGRVNVFDLGSSQERALVAVTSSFQPPRGGEIPHVDLTRDVNDDGLDDLVVPDTDGFHVIVQERDGTFAAPVKVGSATDLSGILGADGYRYEPWGESRIHSIDYNRDGRRDLAFWNKDHFEVHLQGPRGRFARRAKTFRTTVAFGSDQRYSLAAGEMMGTVFHSFADFNGDGVEDLVAFTLEGERALRKRSRYDVHFGARGPDGGTTFGSKVDATFRSPGRIQLGMAWLPFGPDAHALLLITTIETRFLKGSLWKTIKGFMGDDIWLSLEFYQNRGGHFPERPNTIRRVALDGTPSHREPGSVPLDLVLRGATHEDRQARTSWPRAFNRNLLIGDVTGDGLPDLLIETTFRGLDLYAGLAGGELFARRSQPVAVTVPTDVEYSWLVDLNVDGKQDILLHDRSPSRDIHGGPIQPPGTESHRVTILIAR